MRELGIGNGTMLFLQGAELATLPEAKSKAVDLEGNIVQMDSKAGEAFRPGLTSLRSQKMHWTLTDMTELEDKYTFVIKGKEPLFCASATLDLTSAQAFQEYCRSFGFKRPRVAFLYGKFLDTGEEITRMELAEREKVVGANKQYGQTKRSMRVSDLKTSEDDAKPKKRVQVDALYDPKQDCPDSENVVVDFQDPGIAEADVVAKALGLQRVGFMFSHPPGRASTFHFSANEIVSAGYCCLDATDGQRDSPFVVVKVSPDNDGVVQMDAFQLTKTCLDMVADDALLAMNGRPGFCAVRETFHAIVEARTAEVVDTDLLIKRVPILSHTSVFACEFPRLNRDTMGSSTTGPSPGALKKCFEKKLNDPARLRKALLDFNLLLYLSKMFGGVDTVTEIVHELINEKQSTQPFPEGFLLMIKDAARMD